MKATVKKVWRVLQFVYNRSLVPHFFTKKSDAERCEAKFLQGRPTEHWAVEIEGLLYIVGELPVTLGDVDKVLRSENKQRQKPSL